MATALTIRRDGEHNELRDDFLVGPSTELPEIETAEAFCARDEKIPEPEPLIEGFLNPGDLFLLSGASKSYKSWLALQTAICVGSGIPWLGRKTRSGRVLVVNFELKGATVRRRITSIATRLGASMRNVFVWNLRNVCLDADFLTHLHARIECGGYELVILDPLYALHHLLEGENAENSNATITKLLSQVRGACERAGGACMVVHHFAKGDSTSKANIDKAAGAGAFGRFPDNITSISAHEEADAFVLESDLRDHAPLEPFCVRRQVSIMVPDVNLDPSMVRKPGRKREHSADDLLAVLTSPTSSKDWKNAAERRGIKERTYYRLKGELETAGRIKQIQEGKLWCKA